MNNQIYSLVSAVGLTCSAMVFSSGFVVGEETSAQTRPTLNELKTIGAERSSYQKPAAKSAAGEKPKANLQTFRSDVGPALRKACADCHGADTQEADFRIDTLDPDLLHGEDVHWWVEVLGVLSNGEMPPEDGPEISDADRGKVVDWLSSEIQIASTVRRDQQGHSSFRRMTRYEFNYALQDLLGLPYDFAKDLPPDPASEDGFKNSSEMLQMSTMQLGYYRELSRRALDKATVQGERPEPIYWDITMDKASERAWSRHRRDEDRLRKRLHDDPRKLKQELDRLSARMSKKPRGAHFRERGTGHAVQASWGYGGASYALEPIDSPPAAPVDPPMVAVIPAKQRLIIELGNTLPDTGTLRVRVRAWRAASTDQRTPALSLDFGWQASNNSAASVKVSTKDIVVNNPPGRAEIYQWEIPLSEIYPRNPMRKTGVMGKTPSPSEYIRLHNSSLCKDEIHIDWVEVTAPAYRQWPPKSHQRLFPERLPGTEDDQYAREVLTRFMTRAWRRTIKPAELDQKMELLNKILPVSGDLQEAITEVFASVLASPKFLYLTRAESSTTTGRQPLSDFELATRLSVFLWCSVPDDELLDLAAAGRLSDPAVLAAQTNRMLADAKSRRFSKHFVRQWLGMQLLDFLDVDKKAYPRFDDELKEAMQQEPVQLFREVLAQNHSVMDFIHADYAMVNERLSQHYGMRDVYGNHFRKVTLTDEDQRGGLLTQAGLLAMNSDGKDSHPLKRGIWLLERVLNDPPPPPPPAVPEIDLADPEIAKLTLKQRIENHRNDAACYSCHAKIDPWGIAFENFDAVGSWRTEVGGKPVDSASLLFNRQKLDGMDGLKRFLLANRQDQFARAMVHKLLTYALGRPLTFGDRASVEEVTRQLRNQGDGLATLVHLVVSSELFQSI